MFGEQGDDSITLDGATVSANIMAGDGNDTIDLIGGSAIVVSGQSGDDTIAITGGNFTIVAGGADNDSITLGGGTVVSLNGAGGADDIRLFSGTANSVFGERGADTILLDGATLSGDISGGDGDDVIRLQNGTVDGIDAGDGADTIHLDAAATVTGDIDGGTHPFGGADTLILTGTGAFNQSLMNLETVRLDGSNFTLGGDSRIGALDLVAGSNAKVTIPAGASLDVLSPGLNPGTTLRVDGDLIIRGLAGPFFPLDGTLAGDGAVTASGVLFFDPNTVIRPGGSIGTLTLDAIRIHFPSSGPRLLAEIDPAGAQNADLLLVTTGVTGAANLTIEAQPLTLGLTAADYEAANDYTVLQATSLDGVPNVVEGGDLPALAAVSVVGDPTSSGEVVLRFTDLHPSQLPNRPAVTNTGNPNHANLAGAVGGAAGTNPGATLTNGGTLGAAVGTLTNNQLAQFNTVHAEPYSSHLTVQLEQLHTVAGTVMNHTSGLGVPLGSFAGAPDLTTATPDSVEARRRIWGDVEYVSGDVEGENGLGDFDYDIFSLVFGADLYRTDEFNGGVFLGGGFSGMEEHDLVDQEFDTTSFFGGVYGRYEFEERVSLSGVAGLVFGTTDSERTAQDVGGFTGGTAEADFDSLGVFAGLNVQKTFQYDRVDLTPSAGLTYAYISQDAANESGGGDFNLDIDDADADSLVMSFGANLAYPLYTAKETITPVAFARYEYDWFASADDHHSVTATSPLFGSFEQVGQNRGEHGVVAGVGLTYDYDGVFGMGLGYAYSLRSNGQEHGLGANATFLF